ncbi:hypothetical protein HPB51_022133 [Rhipicephalus microplus]|uniref:DUF7041 domain-containing protein n=1 Tax=Rhipicephalus microplus TaxID=6941 RepID=A0A9J6ECL3_RHIMP|nr:hypothetical protein HPB51_022133 [Rhipicephalus microplus]
MRRSSRKKLAFGPRGGCNAIIKKNRSKTERCQGWIFPVLAPTVNGDPIKNTKPRSSCVDPAGSATNPTGPDAQEDVKPSGAAVAAIQHVNLPPFWPNSPSTWFLQVEAHFRLRQITSQQTRHWHLVSCLPPDVADDLADILSSLRHVEGSYHFPQV